MTNFQNMSMYDPSTDSSRNSSITPGMMQSLPSMSNNDFLTAYDFGNGHPSDVISEQDHMSSVPGGDVFFTDGDYLVDDA